MIARLRPLIGAGLVVVASRGLGKADGDAGGQRRLQETPSRLAQGLARRDRAAIRSNAPFAHAARVPLEDTQPQPTRKRRLLARNQAFRFSIPALRRAKCADGFYHQL